MGRRIEVELTSTRSDGTWTWRAAGAKQPKGVVDAALLYEGARVGDVVRADADFEIEGILITAVLPPREKKRAEPERLEIIGPPRDFQGVISSLVPKSERPRPPRGRDGDRDRDRGDRGPRPGGRDAGGRSGPPRPRDAGGRSGPPRPRDDGGRPGSRPPGAESRPRPDGRPRPEGGRPRPEGSRPRSDGSRSRPDASPGSGDRRPERGPRPDRGPRPEGGSRPPARGRREAPAAAEAAAKPKKLAPANVHRAAVVETLPPEQRPIAEQVLRGGIPAVRQAVDAQNARLREQGQPEVQAGPLVAMAEQLLPQLKAAEWRDRAEAAAKVVDEVSLRDLRSVVSGADAARDDEGRILAGTLRQALERRVEEQREKWVADMSGSLDEGRLVRALRLSAHPPDPSTRFPAELAVRLSEAAGAAMSSEATPDRWATLLEAVADSPVRRTVKPVALPAEPGDPLLQAARQASGRVPALAALLGITMPPPPGPPRPVRPGSRPGRDAAAGRRRPPPPPKPSSAGPATPVPAGAAPGGAAAPPASDGAPAAPSLSEETPAGPPEAAAPQASDDAPGAQAAPAAPARDDDAGTRATEAAAAPLTDAAQAAPSERAAPPVSAEGPSEPAAPSLSDGPLSDPATPTVPDEPPAVPSGAGAASSEAPAAAPTPETSASPSAASSPAGGDGHEAEADVSPPDVPEDAPPGAGPELEPSTDGS